MTTRREAIAALAATLVTTDAHSQAQQKQNTFVLVHGAGFGGWVWRRVTDLLERKGQKVFAPTLTGLGERSHLLDEKVSLATHVTDIVNVIKWERLDSVVLVGWSYGGMVITGVAEEMEQRIASIVFLDAVVPQSGESLRDILPVPADRDPIPGALQRGEIAVRPPTAALAETAIDRAWFDALVTPQPIAASTSKVIATGARERIAKKTYIRAANSPDAAYEHYKKFRSAGWRTYEVPSRHAVMVDAPERLVEVLMEVA